jgi:hypothetical protein
MRNSTGIRGECLPTGSAGVSPAFQYRARRTSYPISMGWRGLFALARSLAGGTPALPVVTHLRLAILSNFRVFRFCFVRVRGLAFSIY